MKNKGLKILCLILARGGSKRIPGKNIKLLSGKPLIAYTIECARRSRYINRIVVSTDDARIARVAVRYGAQAPFLRPKNISQSGSKELDAFKHALNWLKREDAYEPDIIVKLFPTSPFRKTRSVDKAIGLLLRDRGAHSVRSVRICSEHPYKMWTICAKRLKSFVPLKQKPKEAHTFSYQVLPKIYIQNASIDVLRASNIYRRNSITGTRIIPLVMDEIESLDINNPRDFYLAECLIKKGLVARE